MSPMMSLLRDLSRSIRHQKETVLTSPKAISNAIGLQPFFQQRLLVGCPIVVLFEPYEKDFERRTSTSMK